MLLLIFLSVIIVAVSILKDIDHTYEHKFEIINIHKNRLALKPSGSRTYNTYTFYSTKYAHTYKQMMDTMHDPRLNVKAIEVPQSDMDACFTKTEKHFYDYRWRGCDIKPRLIVECIKKHMGDYILFIDSDLVFIKPISPIMDYYVENKYDIVIVESCFVTMPGDHCLTGGGNIGLVFMHCNDRVLKFFENVRDKVNDENGWDEGIVKRLLSAPTNLKHGRFPAYLISTQAAFNPESHLVKIIGSFVKLDKNAFQKKIMAQLS